MEFESVYRLKLEQVACLGAIVFDILFCESIKVSISLRKLNVTISSSLSINET